MTARYVEIGQHPDIRRELRGTLAEVLTAPSPNPGTFAMPEDVPGCFLEMGLDGLWTGASVGSFGAFEELDALPTAYLATGARASVNGVQYTYGDGGWGVAGGGGAGLSKVLAMPYKPWPMQGSTATANLAASTTYSQVIEAPDTCYAAQVVFYNPLRSVVPLLGAKLTTIASVAGSTATSGVSVTVGGASTYSMPAADSTNSTSPGGILLSDPVYFTPANRADSSPRTLVMLKIAFDTVAGAAPLFNQAHMAMCPILASGSAAGNALSSSFAATQPSAYMIAGFIFHCKTGKITVGVFGDSLMDGTSSGGTDVGGGLVMACAALGLPLANWAMGGQAGAARNATIDRVIAAGVVQHSITFVEMWSQNNGSTPAATWGIGMISYEKLRKAGANPIVVLPAPNNAHTDWVLDLKAKILASGLPYFDMFTPLANPDGTFKSGFSDDGLHPNYSGMQALRDAYVEYLTPMM